MIGLVRRLLAWRRRHSACTLVGHTLRLSSYPNCDRCGQRVV